jgi:hypothetical protein
MPKIDPFKTPDGKPISNAIEQWDDLSDRDFVVAGCAVMDANLTHLLQGRLTDLPKIAEDFFCLGDKIEGGGASTLSSKAELAALVGLITPEYVPYLKAFMRIRNHFAHRVVMDFMTDCVVKELNKLKSLVEQTTLAEWENDPNPNVRRLYQMSISEGTRKIGKTNQAGRAVFSWSRVMLEVHFWKIDSKNERVKTLKWNNLPKPV